jgi:hypothetical protein
VQALQGVCKYTLFFGVDCTSEISRSDKTPNLSNIC